MADTRSANSEYQLEVDIMILEYLLYHTLESFFHVAKGLNSFENLPADAMSISESGNEKMLTMFDAFMQVFRINHPDHMLSTETKFDLCILETLMLLHEHETEFSVGDADEMQASANSRIARHEEWQEQVQQRQDWTMLRSDSMHLRTKEEDAEVEDAIFGAWSQYLSSTERDDAAQKLPSPLFRVLHHFMTLSAEIGQVMGSMSEKLMQLACDTMLQTALEVLSTSRTACQQSEQLTEDLSKRIIAYDHFVVPILEHIFAYGYVQDLSKMESDHESPSLINGMFSEVVADPNDDTSITVENPKWTAKRHATILEFQIQPRSSQDQSVYTKRLTRLRQKYPYEDFKTNLIQCLEHFWALNHDRSQNGLPVLVQIEKGGLQGLSKAEFEDFMINCGIKRGDRGNIIVGLNLEASLRGSVFT